MFDEQQDNSEDLNRMALVACKACEDDALTLAAAVMASFKSLGLYNPDLPASMTNGAYLLNRVLSGLYAKQTTSYLCHMKRQKMGEDAELKLTGEQTSYLHMAELATGLLISEVLAEMYQDGVVGETIARQRDLIFDQLKEYMQTIQD